MKNFRRWALGLMFANSLGTSERVIDQTYYDFQTEKEMAELMKRASVADLGSVTYDENGYPILR